MSLVIATVAAAALANVVVLRLTALQAMHAHEQQPG